MFNVRRKNLFLPIFFLISLAWAKINGATKNKGISLIGGGYIIFHVADYFLSLFYFRPQLFRRQLIPAAFIFGQAQKQRKYFYYRRRALNDYYFQRRILFLFFWPLFGRRYYSAANRKIIV